MAAADWTTFVESRLFWIKMVSFGLLDPEWRGARRRRARVRERCRRY